MLIGTRTLHLQTRSRLRPIAIEVQAPEASEGSGWFCRYSIDWPKGLSCSEVWGHDALQAVELTMMKIGVDLYASAYQKSGKLFWEQPGRGYGFPLPKNGRDLLIGDDAVFYG